MCANPPDDSPATKADIQDLSDRLAAAFICDWLKAGIDCLACRHGMRP